MASEIRWTITAGMFRALYQHAVGLPLDRVPSPDIFSEALEAQIYDDCDAMNVCRVVERLRTERDCINATIQLLDAQSMREGMRLGRLLRRLRKSAAREE